MGKLAGKTVLITGSTGFVGSNLVRRSLKEGADVHIITRENSDKWRLKDVLTDLNEYHADLTDYNRLKSVISEVEPSIIFHLATYGGDASQNNAQKIIESNFMGTFHLVNASKEVGFDLLVNTSSSSEYGIKSEPMQEDDPLEPVNDYGVSKAAATLYCQSVAKRENLPLVTLRLFSPYGYYEGPDRLIPSIILSCLTDKPPQVSSPNFVRDFIFIDDVLDSYLSLVKNPPVNGEIFNIGSGKQHTIGDVVNLIIELSGYSLEPQWGREPKWSNEPLKWQANITKAKKYLKWAPDNSLKSGLSQTWEWFLKNKELYYI
ncbi:MAG TPA: NAD-dependent epimerase/dehydratase family protein [Methanobacteriaceae archaeon]|nr:NAD-dependent epimerase/dehydratase family protein [Methanobacteriaceae archaeon]